jgi:hypothetical protein
MAAQATPSQVLIFGDSWAAYPLVRKTWPMELAELFGAPALNFAVPGSRTDQLLPQFERVLTDPALSWTEGGEVAIGTLAVIHTAGNDFMQRMGVDLLQQLPGAAEADAIKQLMESLYDAGVRCFLVADVPFAPCVPGVRLASPMIQSLVDAGRMEHLGIDCGDPAELAVELQSAALHDVWKDMIRKFQAERPDAIVAHFEEAFVLSQLRESIGDQQFDSTFFDLTLIHPSAYGHQILAKEARACLQQTLCC